MKRLFTLFIGLSSTVYVSAQATLLTDDFAYTAGQLTDASSGANVSGGNWVNFSGTGGFIPVVSPGLTYAGYPGAVGSNNKITIASQATTTSQEDVQRVFSPVSTGSVYATFLLNVTDVLNLYPNSNANGAYFFTFLPSGTSTSAFVSRLSIRLGVNAAKFQLGIRNGSASTTAWTTAEYDPATTYLVVVRYTFVAGTANDVIDLWINPTVPSTVPPAATLTSSDWTGSNENTDVSKLVIRQAGGASASTPSASIDGFRVGTSWTTSVMPLSLKSFKASLVNGKANISWATANETNVNNFAIEKSKDGVNFGQLDLVAAQNASSNNYNYTDAAIATGMTFYRLRINEKDGSYNYSQIIALNAKQSIKLDVFPNPVSNTLVLSHPKAGENVVAKVVTVDGKTLVTYNVQTGATQSSIDVSKLKRGNYIVVFENDGTRNSVQFIKE